MARNNDIFEIVYGFSAILASLFALSLLGNSKVRLGLYIIMTLLAVNAFVIQLCNQNIPQSHGSPAHHYQRHRRRGRVQDQRHRRQHLR